MVMIAVRIRGSAKLWAAHVMSSYAGEGAKLSTRPTHRVHHSRQHGNPGTLRRLFSDPPATEISVVASRPCHSLIPDCVRFLRITPHKRLGFANFQLRTFHLAE